MKLQSLKMFQTTKDMFYKQFECFFCELTGPIMGLREPCPLPEFSLFADVSEEKVPIYFMLLIVF